MKATKKKPTPHNPDNVTPAQLNPRKGGKQKLKAYRFLDREEVGPVRQDFHQEIERWRPSLKAWDATKWAGSSMPATYRTRLTRAELAKLK